MACALYLLEHALWCTAEKEPEAAADFEAFRRWIVEGPTGGGITQAQAAVDTAWKDWATVQKGDEAIVYGSSAAGGVGAKL